jgi:hypothetical protein
VFQRLQAGVNERRHDLGLGIAPPWHAQEVVAALEAVRASSPPPPPRPPRARLLAPMSYE